MMKQTLQYYNARFGWDEEGATAVEYGLLVALIAAVIIGVVILLGGEIRDAFQTIVNGLTGAEPAPA